MSNHEDKYYYGKDGKYLGSESTQSPVERFLSRVFIGGVIIFLLKMLAESQP